MGGGRAQGPSGVELGWENEHQRFPWRETAERQSGSVSWRRYSCPVITSFRSLALPGTRLRLQGSPHRARPPVWGGGLPPAAQGPGAELRHSAWSLLPPSPTTAFPISPVVSRPLLGFECGRNRCPSPVLQLSWRRDVFSPGLTFLNLTCSRGMFPRRQEPPLFLFLGPESQLPLRTAHSCQDLSLWFMRSRSSF